MLMRAICAYFNPPPVPPEANDSSYSKAKKFDEGTSKCYERADLEELDAPPYPGNGRVFTAYEHEQSLEQLDRLRFFGKVLTILSAMVAGTAIVAGMAMTSQWRMWFIVNSQQILAVSLVASICLLYATKRNVKEYPLNYSLLAAFTVAESLGVAVVCAVFAELGMAELPIQAFAATTFIFVGLATFAMDTKQDFTPLKCTCIMVLQAILFYCLAGAVYGHTENLAILVLGALLFCVFVVVDVQLIFARLGPDADPAVLGAITLYLDILNLFMYILRIYAELQKKEKIDLSKVFSNESNTCKRR